MVSIRDVAKEAGVSVGSVSRYLNGQQLKQANMEKIKKAIDTLGYQENIIAKGLKNNRSFSVGLLMNNMSSRLSSDIVASVEEVMENAGYSLLLSGFEGSPGLVSDKIDYLLNHAVDGLILFEVDENWAGVAKLANAKIPVISLNSPNHFSNVDSVLVNDRNSVRRVIEELIRDGSKHIGIIAAPQTEYASRERLAGVDEAINRHPEVKTTVYYGDYSRTSGFEGTQMLIKEKVDAIFVCNFNMSLGAMEYFNQVGIRAGKDIVFSHFDYLDDMSTLISNRIVIQQPARDIGGMCAERLLSRIDGNPSEGGSTFIFENNIVGLNKKNEVKKNPQILD
ncbi:substrate-binding domain-containing protein [Pediococcus acidilactici]|nr:substrate-binding domain-containing protein [Pediococcus acidilactici]KAF0391445.1 substrate-binding domain-containing protein [Pediococcus acidilactici]